MPTRRAGSSGQDVDRRRLPGPIRPKEPKALPIQEAEGEVLNRFVSPKRLFEVLQWLGLGLTVALGLPWGWG